jgi:hypothetical protein
MLSLRRSPRVVSETRLRLRIVPTGLQHGKTENWHNPPVRCDGLVQVVLSELEVVADLELDFCVEVLYSPLPCEFQRSG